MSEIIPLHSEAHRQTQTLLPWYANGSLDGDETALVETHLAECEECQSDLRSDRVLAVEVASNAFDADHGWAAVKARIAAAPTQPARPSWFRRRVALGWAVGAQAAAAALIVGLFWPEPRAPREPTYRALGSAAAAPAANLIVLFRPDSREREIRAALAQAGARIVDGPTASGAFLLKADDAAQALRTLRSSSRIVLAEPIGGGPGS